MPCKQGILGGREAGIKRKLLVERESVADAHHVGFYARERAHDGVGKARAVLGYPNGAGATVTAVARVVERRDGNPVRLRRDDDDIAEGLRPGVAEDDGIGAVAAGVEGHALDEEGPVARALEVELTDDLVFRATRHFGEDGDLGVPRERLEAFERGRVEVCRCFFHGTASAKGERCGECDGVYDFHK